MSLTSYRAAPPRDGCSFWEPVFVPVFLGLGLGRLGPFLGIVIERDLPLFRFGGDLLSHVLRRSTIGATALNGRVRDGIGCFARAMTTKPGKRQAAVACGARGNISVVPSRAALSSVLLLTVVQGEGVMLRDTYAPAASLLFLDQIKPIGPLVPVS
jgi:hypothetical protein